MAFHHPGGSLASYCDVKDSDASQGPVVTALDSIDSGNNTNWLFNSPATPIIKTPNSSITSPAWVEGTCGGDCSEVTFAVNGGMSADVTKLNPTAWFADKVGSPMGVALSATAATHVDITATDGTIENTVGQDIAWTPTDLKGNVDSSKTVTIRKGDSLLLTDSEEGVALSIDTGNGGSPLSYSGQCGDLFECQFATAGTYLVTATVTLQDETQVQHWLTVKVLDVNLDGPIACEVGFQREKGVDIFGGVNSDVAFTSNDIFLLGVSVKEATDYGSRLFLKAKKRGTPVLLARLPGAFGPVIAMQEVDEYTLDIPALENIVVNADTGSGNAIVMIRPYIPNLDFQFGMFAHTTTFAGGETSPTVSTNLFDQAYDAATGEMIGVYNLPVEMPDDEDSYCMSLKVDQHSNHGTLTSPEHDINGTGCRLRVTPLVIPIGNGSGDLIITTITQGKDQAGNVKCKGHDIVVDGTGGPTLSAATTASPCPDPKGPQKGVQKIGVTAGNAAANKYSVKIGGESFADVIIVVEVVSLDVAGAEQVGLAPAHDFAAPIATSGDVTVTVTINPALYSGDLPDKFITWTGGKEVAGNQLQRTVPKNAAGSTDVQAKCGTSETETDHIGVYEIQSLTVTGATADSGNPTVYYTGVEAGGNVQITAVLNPNVTSDVFPAGFVTWSGGSDANSGQLNRNVSKANAGSFPVTATCGSSSKTVTINVNLFDINVSLDKDAGATQNAEGLSFRVVIKPVGIPAADIPKYDIKQLIKASTAWNDWNGNAMTAAQILAEKPGSDPVVVNSPDFVTDTGWDWAVLKSEQKDIQVINTTNRGVTIGDTIYTEVRRATCTRRFRIQIRDHATGNIVVTKEWGYTWNNDNAAWTAQSQPPCPDASAARDDLGAGDITAYGVDGVPWEGE